VKCRLDLMLSIFAGEYLDRPAHYRWKRFTKVQKIELNNIK